VRAYGAKMSAAVMERIPAGALRTWTREHTALTTGRPLAGRNWRWNPAEEPPDNRALLRREVREHERGLVRAKRVDLQREAEAAVQRRPLLLDKALA
jgi:hypothetical protein